MRLLVVFVGNYYQAAQWLLDQPNVDSTARVVPTSGGHGSLRMLQGYKRAPIIANPHGFLVKQGSPDHIVLQEAQRLQRLYG